MGELTHGSLFSGYGGIDIAVNEVFGARTAWVSDIDPGPCKVLAHRFPGVPNLGDITRIDWADVEPVDILSGGSPCQDLSAAGRRAGMTEGTRSNLWVQMREAIATLKPKLVVWENVAGALSARATSELEREKHARDRACICGECAECEGRIDGSPTTSELEPEPGRVGGGPDGPVLRALGRVLGDLAEIGFDAEWATVRASDVGAPHGRARVFLIAWPSGSSPDTLRGGSGRGPSQPGQAGGDYAAVGSDSGGDGGRCDPRLTLLPTPRASDGEKGGPNQRGSKGDLTISSAVHLLPTPKAGDADFGLPRTSGRPPERSTRLATRLHYTDFGEYTPAIRRWETAAGQPAPPPTKPSQRTGKPQLSAEFVEWMMGLPAGWFTSPELGLSRVEQLRIGGNGVVPQQAAHALGRLIGRVSSE